MQDKPRPGARPCIAAFEGCSPELFGVLGCRVGCIDKWLLKQNSAYELSFFKFSGTGIPACPILLE
jgi:hypothetical protein